MRPSCGTMPLRAIALTVARSAWLGGGPPVTKYQAPPTVRTYPTHTLSINTAHSRHNGIATTETIRLHQRALGQPKASIATAVPVIPVQTQKRSGAGSPASPSDETYHHTASAVRTPSAATIGIQRDHHLRERNPIASASIRPATSSIVRGSQPSSIDVWSNLCLKAAVGAPSERVTQQCARSTVEMNNFIELDRPPTVYVASRGIAGYHSARAGGVPSAVVPSNTKLTSRRAHDQVPPGHREVGVPEKPVG